MDGKSATAVDNRVRDRAMIHAPVTRSECVCSVLNISGLAPMSSSASRGTPSSLRARVSYSCAIILNLFAACV
jgi:hypothetical protein